MNKIQKKKKKKKKRKKKIIMGASGNKSLKDRELDFL